MKYYFEKDFLLTDHYDVYRENSPASYDLFDVECRFDPNSENYTLLKADHSQKTYDGRICFEEFADGSELYLYNEIVNGKDEVVYLFCQTGGCCSKIWFNGEIVWINESQKYSASKLSLRRGTNTVVCSFVPQVQNRIWAPSLVQVALTVVTHALQPWPLGAIASVT